MIFGPSPSALVLPRPFIMDCNPIHLFCNQHDTYVLSDLNHLQSSLVQMEDWLCHQVTIWYFGSFWIWNLHLSSLFSANCIVQVSFDVVFGWDGLILTFFNESLSSLPHYDVWSGTNPVARMGPCPPWTLIMTYCSDTRLDCASLKYTSKCAILEEFSTTKCWWSNEILHHVENILSSEIESKLISFSLFHTTKHKCITQLISWPVDLWSLYSPHTNTCNIIVT